MIKPKVVLHSYGLISLSFSVGNLEYFKSLEFVTGEEYVFYGLQYHIAYVHINFFARIMHIHVRVPSKERHI